MPIPLNRTLQLMYPDHAGPGMWRTARDGNGSEYIVRWNVPGVPQPTPAEITAFVPPPARRKVDKDLVERRLAAIGKLDTCMAIIMGNAAFFSRWYARAFPWVYADDEDTIVVIESVGADPALILAEGDAI